MPALEYGVKSVKNNLSALLEEANRTKEPFIITKNSRPWAKVIPLGDDSDEKRKRKQRLAEFDKFVKELEADEGRYPWPSDKTVEDILGEERMRRFG